MAVIFIALTSCTKEFSKTNSSISSTTQQNLKSDATGVALSSAEIMAQQFLQTKNPNISITVRNAQTIISNGHPYFHVINTNAGFVILSPDSLYSPILAYDSIGNFSFSDGNLNPGLIMWLNKHAHELDFVRNNKNAYTDSIGNANKNLWKCIGVLLNQASKNNNIAVDVLPPTLISSVPAFYQTNSTIGPLCKTLWGQDYPFNLYCPFNPSSSYSGYDLAGCTPVAVAQLMYFWKYPLSTPTATPPPQQVSLNGVWAYPTNFDWANMPLTKQATNFLPTGQDGGMAKLIRDCGSGMSTVYGPTVTSTNADNVINRVLSLMGYSSVTETSSLTQQGLSGANDGVSFAGLLTNEIQTNKRPCIVSGSTEYHSLPFGTFPHPGGNGHTWVCDGSNVSTFYSGTTNTYKDFYGNITTQTTYPTVQKVSLLHMNWGWENPTTVGEYDEAGYVLTKV
jgi:hypothetical protein